MAALLAGSDLLIGPPELCNYMPLADRSSQDDATTPLTNHKSQDEVITGDDFLDMLRKGMKELGSDSAGELFHMAMTENCSPTFLTSDNPLLDFFPHVVPDTPSHRVTELMEAAWNEDPLTALKLVCQLRGVRGTGKSDRDGFYASAFWIHSRDPKTLVANVDSIAQCGYSVALVEMTHFLSPSRVRAQCFLGCFLYTQDILLGMMKHLPKLSLPLPSLSPYSFPYTIK